MASEQDSDTSSSDDDTLQPELSDADMKSILTLEQALKQDPKAYDTHVQYVSALRRAKLSERLKAARRAMHEYFPMTEDLWFEWLDDEVDACDISGSSQIFELAIGDYISTGIWLRYLKFMQGAHAKGDISAVEVRRVNERALSAAGLHVSSGSLLWNQARNWEVDQLSGKETDGAARQVVRSLFHRQLQVPLQDGPSTLQQYTTWEQSLPATAQDLPASVKQGYTKAQAAAKLRAASETAVNAARPADHDLLAAFMAYLKLEEVAGDSFRQQVIFERALARFPVTSHLWLQYARFAESKLENIGVVNDIYKRAARNCPWVGSIWARGLYALERSGVSEKEHMAVYSRALASGLQTSEDAFEVVLAHIDFIRRQRPFDAALLRKTFKEASSTLQELAGVGIEDQLRLTSYWADCEARLADDVTAARSVWEDVVQSTAGRSGGPWSAYITMERALHNTDEVRSLYKRCCTRQFADGSQTALCHAWIRFEREEGSAVQQLQASLKVEPILNAAAASAAAAADAANAASATAAVQRAPMLSHEEMRELRRQKDPNYGQRKSKKVALKQSVAGTKRQASPDTSAASVEPPSSKRARGDDSRGQDRSAPSTILTTAAQPDNTTAMDVDAGVSVGDRPAAATPVVQGREVKGAPTLRDDSMTVFVKNMNFKVTDKELWDFFSDCGTVVKVAVKRDDKGNSKGFAFVHFNSEEAVKVAILKNQTPLRGRPLVIQQSQPLPVRNAAGRGGGHTGGDGGRGGRGGGRGRGKHSPAGAKSDTMADGPSHNAAEAHGGPSQDSGSREAGSLGKGTGPGGWASGRSVKQKLELKQPAKKSGLGFTPRAVLVTQHGTERKQAALQNKDFRNFLLDKTSPAGDQRSD